MLKTFYVWKNFMKYSILVLSILLFSFQVNSKTIETNSSNIEIQQSKYQNLPQDKTFSQLFSRWAALDDKKIQWKSSFDKKIYSEDLSLNKKFKGINTSKEAIEVFIKTFESHPRVESLLYYVIYEQGDTVLSVYDDQHYLCFRLKQFPNKKAWEESSFGIGYNYNELYIDCNKNKLF